MFVLDASVVIKWFSEEKDTKKALLIREKFVNGELEIALPDLVLYEVSNGLRFNQNFNKEDIENAINSLFDLEIDIIVPTSEILKSAVEFAFKFNITVYDSLYIALAKELNFKFITADKKLYEKIKSLDFVKFLEKYEF